MLDREILDYCLKNLDRYSPQELREALLKQGNYPVAIEEALEEAQRLRTPKPPSRFRWAVAGALLLLLLALAAWLALSS